MSTAIILSCHGTVSNVDEIPAFLSNIRRGRPAPPELVTEVKHRFTLIGGSPLMKHTADQASGLSRRLGLPVEICARLWNPYASEVIARLAAQGVRSIVSLPLAPQSVDIYNEGVKKAVDAAGLQGVYAPSWGDEPSLVDAFVETIEEALSAVPAAIQRRAIVLTAHSLPIRVIASGDSYEEEFRAMATRVAARFASHHVAVAFQSQGASAEPWLGPDLPQTFAELAAQGFDGVVVAPIGFLAEHVETLYDLDVEAPTFAARAGLAWFSRAKAVGDRPKLVDALEQVARRLLRDLP